MPKSLLTSYKLKYLQTITVQMLEKCVGALKFTDKTACPRTVKVTQSSVVETIDIDR